MTSSTRATFERYLRALQTRDFETLRELAHPDFEDHYPQSGELTRGVESLIRIVNHYPGGDRLEDLGQARVIGGDDRYVRTPSFTIVRIDGSGDDLVGVQRARYPDGSLWIIIVIAEMRDDLVYRTESFFAPAFEPADWRAPWVEHRDWPSPTTEPGATSA